MADGTTRANEERLWQTLMDLAKIGATPGGGVGRIALTEDDRKARDQFVAWCKEAGCDVRVDRMGNIFARRPGLDADRPPVMTGSHLDTQPLGGRFDGIFGVLAGLEVVRSLNDAGIDTVAPLDIVVWTDEEGVRFSAGMVASGVFAGKYDLDYGLGIVDGDGVTFGEALKTIGYAGTEDVGGIPVEAFFEAHIEQGPILENDAIPIGVVLGAQGQRCFRVTVEGEEGHAGTLPMEMRRDAMLGAARMIDAINGIAFQYDPHPVITVGLVNVRPNSPNTIPGQVYFSIDSRHPDNDTLKAVEADMRAACETIAGDGGYGLDVELVSERESTVFHRDCVEAVADAADTADLPYREIYSGAGHDACNLALCAPTGMIFVPCEGGISHNERENARPSDLAAGCTVLMHAMLNRAGVA